MNDTLKGQENFATWTDVVNAAAGIEQPGNDVTLTLNSKIQAAAEEALQGYSGAIVVLSPQTGAVLACASSPTYSNADIDELLATAAQGADQTGGALINRAMNALYAPGSTFKMVTLTSALQNGVANADSVIDAPAFLEIGNAPVTNAGDVGYGEVSLQRAFEVSSNTAFGQIGVDLGAQTLMDTAEKFGFNKDFDLEVPLTTSLTGDADAMTEWETAWAACGQAVGDSSTHTVGPQATVMQMAMVASAIANDGVLQQPYFVEGVYNAQGERSYTGSGTSLGAVMDSSTANEITEMMKGVVSNGTGYAAAIDGVQVAGKTGTAETGKEYDDSWFVGFAPADNPSVVVAVIIEQGVNADTEDESGLASPRAKTVLETALQVQGMM